MKNITNPTEAQIETHKGRAFTANFSGRPIRGYLQEVFVVSGIWVRFNHTDNSTVSSRITSEHLTDLTLIDYTGPEESVKGLPTDREIDIASESSCELYDEQKGYINGAKYMRSIATPLLESANNTIREQKEEIEKLKQGIIHLSMKQGTGTNEEVQQLKSFPRF
jgi:hypothetical protein